ncbi:hypothetical protein OS493_002016 [Desmophyllum pertusum]|uniref:Uncharacterized protein n=1 Tax=Desmophyllum pertusum TaxID=174260 RepID=A0A9X0CVU8_9CNID|nr:hypothetical protein OS493_002016 [Desmophyllum pertusum]
MAHRSRSNSFSDHSEPDSRHHCRTTTPVVPRGQDRPWIPVDRSRSRPAENRIPVRDIVHGSEPSADEETSPTHTAALTPYRTERRTITPGTTAVVPRGPDRPRISIERSRPIRRDLPGSGPEDETSPTYPPVAYTRLPSVPPSSASSRSTPVMPLSHVRVGASCCNHERQFDALQRKLAALTEKNRQLTRISTRCG